MAAHNSIVEAADFRAAKVIFAGPKVATGSDKVSVYINYQFDDGTVGPFWLKMPKMCAPFGFDDYEEKGVRNKKFKAAMNLKEVNPEDAITINTLITELSLLDEMTAEFAVANKDVVVLKKKKKGEVDIDYVREIFFGLVKAPKEGTTYPPSVAFKIGKIKNTESPRVELWDDATETAIPIPPSFEEMREIIPKFTNIEGLVQLAFWTTAVGLGINCMLTKGSLSRSEYVSAPVGNPFEKKKSGGAASASGTAVPGSEKKPFPTTVGAPAAHPLAVGGAASKKPAATAAPADDEEDMPADSSDGGDGGADDDAGDVEEGDIDE